MIFHPWRYARDRFPAVDIVFARLEGRSGETDGRAIIRLDNRLLQVERRCTLTHELIHVERGDTGACSPAIEREIDREAARRLISHTDLLLAAKWARNAAELADELWVTPDILEARFETMTAPELMEYARAAGVRNE